MPPFYWFIVLGIVIAVSNGYIAERLSVSYRLEIVKNSGKESVIRSSISNVTDIDNWVEVFGKHTGTKWNSRTSKLTRDKHVCS
jgi:hypothetical protein